MRPFAFLALPLLLAQPPQAQGQADPEAVRRELARPINEERRLAGSPPLRASAALTDAAQGEAEEIGRAGRLPQGRGAAAGLDQRLRDLGYRAAEWAESMTVSASPLAAIIADWKSRDPGSFAKLMDRNFTELGIGVGRLRGTPLYVFVFAVPEAESFARRTAGLKDLSRVRAELLQAVAAVRRKAGLPALTPDPRLDRAAQRHAEDMLARSYFAHASPEKETARERASAAGYAWRAIGENIAEGQLSVEEVMAGWMKSRHHRENLLSREFTQVGSGLALGRDPRSGDSRSVWVQVFGRPR